MVRIVDPNAAIGALVLRDAASVPAGVSLQEAAAVMRALDVSALLVEGGSIVTERDIALAVAMGIGPMEPVDAVASHDPVRVPSTASVVDATATMLNRHVRHLIVDRVGDRPGIVSLRDVVAVLLQATTPEIWLASLRVAIDAPAEIWLG